MKRSGKETKAKWLKLILIISVAVPSTLFGLSTEVSAQNAPERQNSVVSIFNRFKKDVRNARGIQRNKKPETRRTSEAATTIPSGKNVPIPRNRPIRVASTQPVSASKNDAAPGKNVINRLTAMAFQQVRPKEPLTGNTPTQDRNNVAPVPRRAQTEKRSVAAAILKPVLPSRKDRQRTGAPLILTKVSPSVFRTSCPKRQLIGLTGIRAPNEIKLSPQANVQRKVGLATANWMRDVVQPAAKKHLGSEVVQLRVAASFACRTRNGIRGAKLSEHGYGNAIDISIFTLANGKKVSVAKGWRGRKGERLFLRAVNDGACSHFTTVLGPRADRYHQDHFHFDLASHGKSGNRRVCK
ncbi:MAG: extensin family protein [Hyphomicrobiales bacterium]